jgi:hypothetical protein
MTTLLDKWQYYKNVIKLRETEFAHSVLPPLPRALYSVSHTGEIEEKKIISISYRRTLADIDWSCKKPTKKDVEKIRKFAEAKQEFKKENIIIHWSQRGVSFGTANGGSTIKELEKFISLEEAEALSIKIRGRIKREKALMATGDYERCERCEKVTLKSQIVKSSIVDFRKYGSAGMEMHFCSEKCAEHEQMSRERS